MSKTSSDVKVDCTRKRLDALLVWRDLAASRERARDLIISGAVSVDGQIVQKPAKVCAGTSVIELKQSGNPWVSRAGLKLAGAITGFKELDFTGCKAIDIGASTGGFTEVLLAHGVDHVVSVDVGCGQLHERLAADDRVTILDNTNARYLTASILPYMPDIIVCDASFISLQKLLPAALGLAKTGASLVALIKPQFQVGKGLVGKGGIVRDAALRKQALTNVVDWLEKDMGWHVRQTMQSPIIGPNGNVEFLLLAQKPN